MRNTPLSGDAASPRSRSGVRCGQGEAPNAAGRPLRGGRWAGPRQFLGLVCFAEETTR